MAPVHSSPGPAPNLLTPGPISSGLVPNPPPAAPYVPSTNKELEILFQPMFDEYFESSTVNRLVPPAPAAQALVNPTSPSVSIPIDQETPSGSHSPSSSDHQSSSVHQGVAAEHPFEEPFSTAMQDEIHEFDQLDVWELVPPSDCAMIIALKWIYKVKLDGLKKALYVLKQAPRVWYDTLSKFLLGQGFSKGVVDPTLFISENRSCRLSRHSKKYIWQCSVPWEQKENGVVELYFVVGFNSLVHSFRALSSLRCSGMRTASAAAKPCQGDSSEFYLITDFPVKAKHIEYMVLNASPLKYCSRGANYVNMQSRIDERTCNIRQKYVKSQTHRQAKRGDRMERNVTTASSLEAEQDSGNINITQSMAILNESFPQGADSGSGPRCQVTILGDAEAQT
ncbi:retrovirus-related pol polyprotein from transposon TNT 1-94, partial [Tanacetum coccineum]